MQNNIPKWVLAFSYIFSLLGFFISIALYVSPQTFLTTIDFHARGAWYLLHMFASRELAIALGMGYAAWKKSASMLKIVLIVYVIMNIQDAFIGFFVNDLGLLIGAFVVGAIAASMAYCLSKKNK